MNDIIKGNQFEQINAEFAHLTMILEDAATLAANGQSCRLGLEEQAKLLKQIIPLIDRVKAQCDHLGQEVDKAAPSPDC